MYQVFQKPFSTLKRSNSAPEEQVQSTHELNLVLEVYNFIFQLQGFTDVFIFLKLGLSCYSQHSPTLL